MKKSLSLITIAILLLMLLVPAMAEPLYESSPEYEFDFMTPTGPGIPNTGEYIDIEAPLTPTGARPIAPQTADSSNGIILAVISLCLFAGTIVTTIITGGKKHIETGKLFKSE